MKHDPAKTLIYHITDVSNLPEILAAGGLHSDAIIAKHNPDVTVIGYAHIKQRRMREIQVTCCDKRFVGEFWPFYFCPRSPMLLTINSGNTGRPPGAQRTIVHLASTLATGINLDKPWAISDGNAGAYHTSFYSELAALSYLDWEAIRATQWKGRIHQKSAEFLVADFFPWEGVQSISCHNPEVVSQVQNLLDSQPHKPAVAVNPHWYY